MLANCHIAPFLVLMITGSNRENFQLGWTLRESVLHGDIPSVVNPEHADTHYELLLLPHIVLRNTQGTSSTFFCCVSPPMC